MVNIVAQMFPKAAYAAGITNMGEQMKVVRTFVIRLWENFALSMSTISLSLGPSLYINAWSSTVDGIQQWMEFNSGWNSTVDGIQQWMEFNSDTVV